jgi:hypothetical protein
MDAYVKFPFDSLNWGDQTPRGSRLGGSAFHGLIEVQPIGRRTLPDF